MSASITDKITDVRNSARPVTARVTVERVVAGTTLTCNSLTGWPTASKVHFVTYQVDTNNNPIAGTQLDCSGIVSGSTITSLQVIDGTDGGNSVGDYVEMLPTSAWGQDLAEALTTEHDRGGVHNDTAIATIGAALYPVGSVYINAGVSTNPASLLGFGTWTAFGSGRVLVGVDTSQTEFDTLGETGGSKTHTLTINEMPAHSHKFRSAGLSALGTPPANWDDIVGASVSSIGVGPTTAEDDANNAIQQRGGGAAHNNLQPYITVYMWKRTA